MSFTLSPGVSITETDLSAIIPNVSSSIGASVGQFQWGVVNEIMQLDNEQELVNTVGTPTNSVFTDFMCSSSFLAYATGLQLVRVVHEDALNASCTASAGGSGELIQNVDVYNTIEFSSSPDLWIAKYPGVLGDNVGVAWANTSGFNAEDSHGNPIWPYANLFAQAPGTSQFHIVVYDAGGGITGTIGSILETYTNTSLVQTAKNFDGTTAYVLAQINQKSAWIWMGKIGLLTGTSNGVQLAGGDDGSAITDADRATGWDVFADPDATTISLAFVGGADVTASLNVIQNIAETRKDCVAFVSPQLTDVVNQTPSAALAATLVTRESYGSSSYAFMDSCYKLMYDRYNDVNRYIPLNGDVAGLCAQATNTNDAWWSPAGVNRGIFKNCIKLSYIQNQSIRDQLYQQGVNPCISQPTTGPMLWGDKTLQSVASAFDRIGVRRLFIVLEKSIAIAANGELFNFNDAITRAQFVNEIEPFLTSIQGRRGLQQFQVICDTTNNTPQVIAANQFVASIWILPNYSINFINLNFICVNSAVQFTENVVTT
jgi:phage tail sheath protein FI